MKVISIQCRDGSIEGGQFTCTFEKAGLRIGISRLLRHGALTVRFQGASLASLDASHNLRGAAAGAIAGGLLLGPIGLLAGGAIGAARKHTLVLASPDARVVLETSTKELQRFAGLGLSSNLDSTALEGVLPPFRLSFIAWCLIVAFSLWLLNTEPRLAIVAVAAIVAWKMYKRAPDHATPTIARPSQRPR